MELSFGRTSNCQEVGYAPRRRDMNPNIQSFASDKQKTKKANQNSHDSARSPVNARRNASEERPHEKTRSSQAEVVYYCFFFSQLQLFLVLDHVT